LESWRFGFVRTQRFGVKYFAEQRVGLVEAVESWGRCFSHCDDCWQLDRPKPWLFQVSAGKPLTLISPNYLSLSAFDLCRLVKSEDLV
jgi:hypothetical protein